MWIRKAISVTWTFQSTGYRKILFPKFETWIQWMRFSQNIWNELLKETKVLSRAIQIGSTKEAIRWTLRLNESYARSHFNQYYSCKFIRWLFTSQSEIKMKRAIKSGKNRISCVSFSSAETYGRLPSVHIRSLWQIKYETGQINKRIGRYLHSISLSHRKTENGTERRKQNE